MAKIIKDPVGFSKNVWKGGIANGAITGFAQGTLAAVGLHQFFARLGGGIAAASFVKNKVDKRVILLESTKEAVFQIMAGE